MGAWGLGGGGVWLAGMWVKSLPLLPSSAFARQRNSLLPKVKVRELFSLPASVGPVLAQCWP